MPRSHAGAGQGAAPALPAARAAREPPGTVLAPVPLVLRWLARLALVLTALVPAAAGAAQPSFLDPFDEGVFGYVSTVGGVTIGWSDVDVAGAPDSGSALLVNTRGDAASGPVNWVLDCFAVEPGTPYTAGASILIPAGQARTGVAQVFVSWFSSGSCGLATILSQGRTFEVRNPGSWVRSEEPLLAPAGAAGARVGMTLFKNEPGGSLAAHFDDLLFVPEPTASGAGVAAAIALQASARRRRRRDAGA